MAKRSRRRRRSTRRSNSSRLFKKKASCPASIKRVCKKARLAKAKGCSPSIVSHLGRR